MSIFWEGRAGADVIVHNSNWIGLDEGSWHEASNWNPNFVPNNTSNLKFSVRDGMVLVTGETTNAGTIRLICAKITFQGGLSNTGSIIEESGTCGNIADFNLDGTVDGTDLSIFATEYGWVDGQ